MVSYSVANQLLPMKTIITFIALTLAVSTTLPARAQMFRPQTINDAVLGGIAGAIIGNNSGDRNGARGAVIGAAIGGLLGSASANEPTYRTLAPEPVSYSPAPPNSVLSPVLLGGVAGAIIGNNSGRHNPWRGAAIGAGAGYVLHRVITPPLPSRILVEPPRSVVVYAPAPVVFAAPAPVPAPQSVTIINNYYYGPATPMSDANTMFGR